MITDKKDASSASDHAEARQCSGDSARDSGSSYLHVEESELPDDLKKAIKTNIQIGRTAAGKKE